MQGLADSGMAPTTIEYLNEAQLRELLFNRPVTKRCWLPELGWVFQLHVFHLFYSVSFVDNVVPVRPF